ncbi:MAG: glycosyltransferase, partial [Planctomycetota bacterium]|nr:glycosyltransferase [Planctomycetota bacterium]
GGAPVSIIEASATAMPVLSTTHCDIPEVVIDGETGVLAPERDVGALAAGLERLVARSDDWKRLGEAARRRMDAEFDVRSQAARLAALYRELVSGAVS